MARKRNNSFSEKDLAKYIITSKENAEIFIAKWISHHHSTREKALKRLRQLGVHYSDLRNKQ